ncbi:MAG: hypothetical protein RTV41_03360 [Candidatus Thorarchaeota archaeon]
MGFTVEEFHSDSEIGTEQALRGLVRKMMIIGIVMFTLLPLGLVLIFLLQNSLPPDIITILFILICPIGILGVLVFVYYKGGSSMLFSGMDILRQITPPEPFFEGKFAVLNKDPVYAIAQWGSGTLLFVAFVQAERTFDQKAKLPRAIWRWEYTHPIGDIKVARREDSFTIPVGRDTYYTGRGILYSLVFAETTIVTLHKSYTAEQLNQIVNSLAQEVVTYESRSQSVDDDFE